MTKLEYAVIEAYQLTRSPDSKFWNQLPKETQDVLLRVCGKLEERHHDQLRDILGAVEIALKACDPEELVIGHSDDGTPVLGRG